VPDDTTQLIAAILAHAATAKQDVESEDATRQVGRNYRHFLRVLERLNTPAGAAETSEG